MKHGMRHAFPYVSKLLQNEKVKATSQQSILLQRNTDRITYAIKEVVKLARHQMDALDH